jgi:hypothetical protein
MSINILSQIDAIANGVEARYEPHEIRLGPPTEEAVINEVVAIAKKLRIPKDTVEEWMSARLARSRAKAKIVEVSTGRV